MKHKHKRATRAQRDQRGELPNDRTCHGCGFIGSKYQLKQHKELCRGS